MNRRLVWMVGLMALVGVGVVITGKSTGFLYGWKVREINNRIQIIREGDSIQKVLELCGEPLRKIENESQKEEVWIFANPILSSQPAAILVNLSTQKVVSVRLAE